MTYFDIADSGRTAIFCWARIACPFDVIAYPFHVVGRSTVPSHLRYWPHVSTNSVRAGACDGGLLIGSDLHRQVPPPSYDNVSQTHDIMCQKLENRVTSPNLTHLKVCSVEK
jgi:hypothetical protein